MLVSDFLEHHGVKGMHWGVRRDRSGSSGNSGVPVDHSKRNKALKIAGGVVAVAAVTAGTIYLAKHPELLSKAANALTNEKNVSAGKKFVEEHAKPKNDLTGVAHITGAGYLPDRTHRKGGLSDVFSHLTKHDLADQYGEMKVRPGQFKRYGDNLENVAVSFHDPHGRTDAVKRPIVHQILLPKEHAEGITDFESAKSKAWSLVKDSYKKFSDYANSSVNVTNEEARRLGLMD